MDNDNVVILHYKDKIKCITKSLTKYEETTQIPKHTAVTGEAEGNKENNAGISVYLQKGKILQTVNITMCHMRTSFNNAKFTKARNMQTSLHFPC